MKDNMVICPQCGSESPNLEEDSTSGDPVEMEYWVCPKCGYPDVIAVKEG